MMTRIAHRLAAMVAGLVSMVRQGWAELAYIPPARDLMSLTARRELVDSPDPAVILGRLGAPHGRPPADVEWRRQLPADVCARRGCTHGDASHLDGGGACGYCPCPGFVTLPAAGAER